jgi:hypothetical protein
MNGFSTPPRTRINRNGTLTSELGLIRRKLNGTKKPWAVSGSMAMKLHANRIGVPLHRQPNDIDIVIRAQDYHIFIGALASIGYTTNKPPPIRFQHMKLTHGRFSIDLLAADSNLAPNITKTNIIVYDKTPVVKIRHLIRQKNRTLSNNNTSVARQNRNFLKAL